MRDVDDLLAGLRAAPVPPLPGAAAARARGGRRAARSRLAAGALAVTGVAAAAALAGAVPRSEPAPPVATASRSTTVTPSPAGGPAGGLLDPEDAAAALGGSWRERQRRDIPLWPLPASCDGGQLAAPTSSVFLDGPGGAVVGHLLVTYGGDDDAARAFGALARALRPCALPGSTATRVYADRDGVLVAVERVGPAVSGVGVRGGSRATLPGLAQRAAAEARCGGPCPWSPGEALLDIEDAEVLEGQEWSAGVDEVEPGLAPCGGGTPPAAAATAAGALAQRYPDAPEVGGTGIAQEVHRYRSDRAAAAALDAYERAVRDCPRRPEGKTTTVYEVVAREDAALYVRVRDECDGCVPWPAYLVVVREGDGLAVLEAGRGEDGDPGLAFARRWGRAAAEELRRAQRLVS